MEFKYHLGSHCGHLYIDGVHMPMGDTETLHKCDLSDHSAFLGKLEDKLVPIGL